MVAATLAFTMVITRTPRKLKTAAIKMALRALIARVETQVAVSYTHLYSYLGWSSFQRGEMISILNCPEKLMHIFFENPVTCSPYSVSLTDAWAF